MAEGVQCPRLLHVWAAGEQDADGKADLSEVRAMKQLRLSDIGRRPAGRAPRKPLGPSHTELKRAIRDLLKWARYEHYPNTAGMGCEVGLPDLTAIEPTTGRYIGIEVKVGRDELRPAQIKWRDRILRSCGIFIEARSVDDVIAGLGLGDGMLFGGR